MLNEKVITNFLVCPSSLCGAKLTSQENDLQITDFYYCTADCGKRALDRGGVIDFMNLDPLAPNSSEFSYYTFSKVLSEGFIYGKNFQADVCNFNRNRFVVDSLSSDWIKRNCSLRGLEIGYGRGDGAMMILNNLPGTILFGIDIACNLGYNSPAFFPMILDLTYSVKLPFDDGSLDFVSMMEVIEHVSVDDSDKFLRLINSVLKIGGKLVLSTPLKGSIIADDHIGHVHEYELKELQEKLERFGFKVIDRKYSSCLNTKQKECQMVHAKKVRSIC